MTFTYGSVCSGIEAATCAWHGLGWTPKFFSEIEKFPSGVLAHHYGSNMPGEPLAKNGIPNHGDFTKIGSDAGPVDLLVGGTPCQSFSVAGKRLGLDDPRGNLALEFLALARRLNARWILWENVPGVLSSRSDDGSHDFATFLSFVQQCGYGFAYRVLDAQHVRTREFPWAVPQRRRRVFLVGYLGDWRRSAAVLFDAESLRGDPAPGRKSGQGITHEVAPSLVSSGRGVERAGETRGQDPVVGLIANSGDAAYCVNEQRSNDAETETLIAHALRGEGFDASEAGTGRGTPIVPVAYRTSGNCRAWETGERVDALVTGADPNTHLIAFSSKDYGGDAMADVSPTLRSGNHDASHANAGTPPAVAFDMRGRDGGAMPEEPHDTANIRAASGGSSRSYVAQPWAVRRLTPVECERLQGFPDGYTDIPWRGKDHSPDGPRYKALGNSMAVNVMQWIGERIAMVEALVDEIDKANAS